MFRGRVLAPSFVGLGLGGVAAGAALAFALGWPWGALGVAVAAGGVFWAGFGGALWRYQERQRRRGWPE